DALEVDRRAKVAAQVVVAELDGVAGAGAVNLFTVEGDEQAVDQLGLVEMVAEGAPGKALMEFAVKRAGLGGVGQADDRAEIPPQAVEQRSEAGDVYGHITQSIRFGGVLRVTVCGGLVVGEKHGVAGRHVVRAAVVGKPTAPSDRLLNGDHVRAAAIDVAIAVGGGDAHLVVGVYHPGKNNLGHVCSSQIAH